MKLGNVKTNLTGGESMTRKEHNGRFSLMRKGIAGPALIVLAFSLGYALPSLVSDGRLLPAEGMFAWSAWASPVVGVAIALLTYFLTRHKIRKRSNCKE